MSSGIVAPSVDERRSRLVGDFHIVIDPLARDRAVPVGAYLKALTNRFAG